MDLDALLRLCCALEIKGRDAMELIGKFLDISIPLALSTQEKNEEVSSSSSEIEHRGISIPKCESVDTQVTEERGCSVEITISSGKESQIEQPRVEKSNLNLKEKLNL
ncbi:UNVERIFIED_CONTAM: hypothetical protein RMT77_010632 [Armadillidium vulgare]